MNTGASTTQPLSQLLIDSVEQAVLETFSQFLERVTVTGQDNMNGICDGLLAVISFIGDHPFSLILSLPIETSLAIAKKFTGMRISFESDDMMDLTGELVNILAGPVSAKLTATGMEARMSLPTVARGFHIEMVLPGDSTAHRLHFDSEQGPFRVRVVLPPTH